MTGPRRGTQCRQCVAPLYSWGAVRCSQCGIWYPGLSPFGRLASALFAVFLLASVVFGTLNGR